MSARRRWFKRTIDSYDPELREILSKRGLDTLPPEVPAEPPPQVVLFDGWRAPWESDNQGGRPPGPSGKHAALFNIADQLMAADDAFEERPVEALVFAGHCMARTDTAEILHRQYRRLSDHPASASERKAVPVRSYQRHRAKNSVKN
jgi:hypothetical protein